MFHSHALCWLHYYPTSNRGSDQARCASEMHAKPLKLFSTILPKQVTCRFIGLNWIVSLQAAAAQSHKEEDVEL